MVGLFLLLLIALGLVVAALTGLLVWEMTHPPRRTAGYAVARGMVCDPSEIGLAFEVWRLDMADGSRLAVWEATNPQAATELTAIFIHGWGHSRIDMLARIEPWRQLCGRLVFLELRGHGESTQGELESRGTSRLGDGEERDVLALIERIDPERCVLVSHSMGAVIAMAAAAKAEETARKRIVGIAAYGAYMDFHTSLGGRLRAGGFPTRPITDLALWILRMAGITPTNGASVVAAIRCPLLIVHGSQDVIVPIEHAQALAQLATDAGCKVQLVEIESAGHLDLHTADTPSHDAAVRQFVDMVRVEVMESPRNEAASSLDRAVAE